MTIEQEEKRRKKSNSIKINIKRVISCGEGEENIRQ